MEVYKGDVIVVGGGFSGVCASIAAARHGMKVILVHDRPVFGGNASSEVWIGINGAASNGNSPSVYAREGGICEEIKLAMAFYKSRDLAYFDLIYKEKNIISFLNTAVIDVEMENENIKAVFAVQLSSEKKFRFEAPLFCDTSGDGVVAYKAGAEYMYGRESSKQFNEKLAPLEADDYTMGDTILFESVDTGHKVEYRPPEFAYDITKLPFFKNLGADKGLDRNYIRVGNAFYGPWWLEYGGQLNTVDDNEKIIFELRKLVYGFWDYIKNSGDFKNVENLQLSRVAPIAGKRESRRFVGKYIMTQNDIDLKNDYFDSIGIGGWQMDVHAPKGIYDDEPATHWHFVAGMYNIPFGMMVSKNIPNLMFAGRNMSSTHIAFGSTRLTCTGGVAGQAIGTAASLCKKYNKYPDDIRSEHIDELVQELLQDDQTIIGKIKLKSPELYDDLNITTSSTKDFSNKNEEGLVHLKKDFVLALPIKDRLDSLKVKIKNLGNETKLNVEVYGGERKENYIPSYQIKKFSVDIKEKYDDWITLPIECSETKDNKLYLLFKADNCLNLYGTNDKLTGAVSFITGHIDLNTSARYKGCMRLHRTMEREPYSEICFKDVLPEQNIYCAENLINGYNRPYGLPNLWISGEKSNSSEYIKLKYSKPKSIKEIQLVFNTMLEEDNINDVPQCIVKSYSMEVKGRNGQFDKFDVDCNYQRINKFKLSIQDITEIDIILKDTHGSKQFELFGINLL